MQIKDAKIEKYLQPNSSLQLKRIKLPETDLEVRYDVSTGTIRPFFRKDLHKKAAFHTVHQLAQPRRNGTGQLANQRFIWPGIKQDCREWTKTCMSEIEDNKACFRSCTDTALCALTDVRGGQKHTL